MGTAYLWGQGGGGLDADGATAAPRDVVAPYTFIGEGSDELQTGEVADVTQDLTIPINGKVMIPAGFHDGTGKAKQNLTNQGTKNYTLSANGKVTIPAGWHSGSGKVSQALPVFNGGTYTPTAAGQSIDTTGKYLGGNIVVKGDANLKSENIAAKMWGIAAGFTPLETAYTLYKDGTYYGWWKDGLIKNVPLTQSQYATYLFPNNNVSEHGATTKVKPNPLVCYYDGNTSGNFYYDYGYFGLKTIDLSLFKTITINYTVGSKAGTDIYYPAVRPGIYLHSASSKLQVAKDITVDKRLDDGTYSDTFSLANYTGHHYLAVIMQFCVRNNIAGSSSSHGYSYRKATINSIILGK